MDFVEMNSVACASATSVDSSTAPSRVALIAETG